MNTRVLRSTLGTLAGGAAALALVAVAAPAADAAGWKWSITPYAWLTDTGVDVKIADRQVVDETIPVSDLLDDLDTIVQVRLEAQRGPHGLMLDLFDVTLSDEVNGVALPDGTGTADVGADVGMTILDLAGFYDVTKGKQGLVVYAGTRILNERATVEGTITPSSSTASAFEHETDDTMVDGLLGFKMRRRIAGRLFYQMQADVSTGATDYTWSAGPSLGFVLGSSRRNALTVGYRRMETDFEDDGAVAPAMTLSGLNVGFRTTF